MQLFLTVDVHLAPFGLGFHHRGNAYSVVKRCNIQPRLYPPPFTSRTATFITQPMSHSLVSEAEQQHDSSVRFADGFVGQGVWGSVSCKKPRVLNDPLAGHKSSVRLLDL